MSHAALQRALVIALHDPGALGALARGEVAGLDLTEEERGELARVDVRALTTDALRGWRLLGVLAKEYQAALAARLAEGLTRKDLSGFFASELFRRAVARDAPLPLAFGEYLLAGAHAPLAKEVCRLELLRAGCARDRGRAPGPGVALAPGCRVARFDAATLPYLKALEEYLFEANLIALTLVAPDAPEPPRAPPPAAEVTCILFQAGASAVALTPIDEDLLRALEAPHKLPKNAIEALVAEGIVSRN